MRRILQVVVFLLLAAVMTACSPNTNINPNALPLAAINAQVTDYVTNTEARNNHTYLVWVRTDTESAYCTFDEALYNKASILRERVVPVTIEYATVNRNDPEYGYWSTQGCASDRKNVVVYKLISIHEAGLGEPLGETSQ
jgi:hypothetical protein